MRSLAELADHGATHLAFEASSHGLAQYRVDGIRLAAGAFTNISRDHLDYHPDFADYFRAKMRLFTELLQPGQPAVIDVDSEGGEEAAEIARARGLRLITTGRRGDALRLRRQRARRLRPAAGILHEGGARQLSLPLAGDFQAANVLVALGLAIATGVAAGAGLRRRRDAEGRQRAAGTGRLCGGGRADLHRLRAYARRSGKRHPGAAPLCRRPSCMWCSAAAATATGASVRKWAKSPPALPTASIVTDDNPRSEDPAAIRAEILAAAPGARRDRRPRRGHCRGDRRHGAGRSAADRRQGP